MLQERKSVLERATFSGEEKPLAANITQMVIVLAPEPEPSEYLVDQYLIAAEKTGVKVIITINKSDLLDDRQHQSLQQRFQHYEDIGYRLIFISSKMQDGLKPLTDALDNETSILVGQSGVGKSSLTNSLIPDLELQTKKLSEKKQSGQHTTSASTLYELPSGGRLIDSPGVRSFRLGEIDKTTLENGFREFAPFLGYCKFSNCSHTNEPGCAMLEAVADKKIHPQRLQNFLHMLEKL